MKEYVDYKQFFVRLEGLLDERATRLVASAAAADMGYGGISAISRQAGLSRPSIYSGIKELEQSRSESESQLQQQRQRKEGGGRKKIIHNAPEIVEDLESLINPYIRGNPESPLRWTSKSLRKLCDELRHMGHKIGYVTVGKLLESIGYTLQSNKKSHEGGDCPDRDGQFDRINKTAEQFMAENQPVISVDAKKKELIGEFKNNGKEYRPTGEPEKVNVYDFVDLGLGKATPYGIYDLNANEGFVSVGSSHDTAKFAVESIEKWWETMGCRRYPGAHSLFITADGGGSNGSRNKMWKKELQRFADKYELNVYVSHFPPGTSKWNKIEHRMFSIISMNWRGKPLISLEVIVNLIANTKTKTGLKINATINSRQYNIGEKVTDEEFAKLNLCFHDFHPEWNYVVLYR
jgi:transposase